MMSSHLTALVVYNVWFRFASHHPVSQKRHSMWSVNIQMVVDLYVLTNNFRNHAYHFCTLTQDILTSWMHIWHHLILVIHLE